MGQRIKGQEVEVRVISNGKLQDTVTEVVDFEVTVQNEIKKQGLLGETTDRRDDIFNGVGFKITFQFSSGGVFNLIKQITDRSQRRVASFRVNIKASFNFPDSPRRLGIVEDCFFGEIPISFGARGDYGSVTLNGEAPRVRFV